MSLVDQSFELQPPVVTNPLQVNTIAYFILFLLLLLLLPAFVFRESGYLEHEQVSDNSEWVVVFVLSSEVGRASNPEKMNGKRCLPFEEFKIFKFKVRRIYHLQSSYLLRQLSTFVFK